MSGGRCGWAWALAALALALAWPAAGAAQVPSRCVPGSIGPGGCDSIRPLDADPGPLGLDLPPELAPRAEPRGARLIERYGPAPAARLSPVPRLAPPAPPVGRDPRAVQSFQTPYVSDGRTRMR